MKLTTFINKSFGLLERKITSRWFNPLATLYVNFRTMPFNIAWHLPIYVYGRVKFKNLKGKIEFTCNVKPGLIKMGRHDDIYHHAPYGILYYFWIRMLKLYLTVIVPSQQDLFGALVIQEY